MAHALRQHRPATASDRTLEERVWTLHRGDGVPPTRHMLQVSDEAPLQPGPVVEPADDPD